MKGCAAAALGDLDLIPGAFFIGGLQKMAEVTEPSYVYLLIRELRKKGDIYWVGMKVSACGKGRESFYRVIDPAKFRIDYL